MRQLRVNTALLAFALAPLVFTVCVNLTTGGSLTKALEGNNAWVFPFLVASGGALFIYNFREAKSRQQQLKTVPRERMSRVDRVMNRHALTTGPATIPPDDQFDEPVNQPAPDAPPSTVESLVSDLWAASDGDIRPNAYRAAWELAALMPSDNVRDAIRRLQLTGDQLRQPRLKWLVRPREGPAGRHDPVNVIQGRVGYLIKKRGTRYIPRTLIIDPYIAIGLIVVQDARVPYHNKCPVSPHLGDADSIGLLRSLGPAESDININDPTYSDIGRLIRPELSHTNPHAASGQATFIRHVMRHFLSDELSAVLFDSLPDATQARLAMAMLPASRWMSPRAWRHWVETGDDRQYETSLERASDLSFAVAGGLAMSIIVLACWQLVFWISKGWSWYFGSAHFLGTWPGWLKALLVVIVIVVSVMRLQRTYPLGMTVAIICVVVLIAAIMISPVARLHVWVSSWGTASTVVTAALILAALLTWLGFSYADKRLTDEPPELGGISIVAFSRLAQRSRFRPEHDPGHPDWCAVASPK